MIGALHVVIFPSQKNYKAEYEEDRGKGFFPQTITQEYEAIKKLDQCKDVRSQSELVTKPSLLLTPDPSYFKDI